MNKFILTLPMLLLLGCATANVSKNLKMVAFDEKVDADNLKSVGNVEGKDCTWYVFGYGVGLAPDARSAFQSAANQTEQSLIPGQETKAKGPGLKMVRNVSVQDGGFNAWLLRRSCIIVTGVGFQ
jgi:hypothetical protein